MRTKTPGGWWIVPLLAVVSTGAAGREGSLVEAVGNGDGAGVRVLLKKGADVNRPEPDGTTALDLAVERDDLETADLLIRAGANVRSANRYGVPSLYEACTNGSAAMIERLLAAGADPNTALPEGETALMTAARAGNVAAVKMLVAHGADVNATEHWKGQTALMWAAAANNAAAAKALIEAGADIKVRTRSGTFTPYLFAVRGGRLDAARVLLEAGADVNEALPDGTSAMVLAVLNAHYELAAFLLDKGADPNADRQGWTALHQIVWSRRPNTGFNLPGPVQTGSLNSLDLVKDLLRRGADVNARQRKEPRDGYRNQLNRLGATPFLLAAKSADVPLMRLLLENGADPRLRTVDGATALMVAAGVGIWAPGENPGTEDEALAAVKLAFEVGGGDVNDVDKNGETALHGAIYRGGSIPVAKFLIEKGARLDARNSHGWTPLTVADGVVYASNLKRYRETAEFLRQVMKERGLPVPDPGPPRELETAVTPPLPPEGAR
jgi:ankyrin repeat protein